MGSFLLRALLWIVLGVGIISLAWYLTYGEEVPSILERIDITNLFNG